MKKIKDVLGNLKDELSGLLNIMLVSERMNSQRCVAQDIDTTKTIIEHKDDSQEFTQQDINKIGTELQSITEEIKGIASTMLVSERMNSQRCVAQDIDTTKTIIEHKNESKEFTEQQINELADEVKGIVSTMLVSERMNSQRCVAQNIDTTKTIIEHNEKSNEVSKADVEKLVKDLKGIVKMMLVSERMNSQRCVAQDIDTTKTIIDSNE